ncbi:MAG: GntR family transcriptional regulator [Geminicoccaceae bacterium]
MECHATNRRPERRDTERDPCRKRLSRDRGNDRHAPVAAGGVVSENQLSEQLGCGRTPIREALQRLRFQGFVDIHPRRGAQVSSVDIVKQLELLEVRRPLEALVADLATRRAHDQERAAMSALAVDIRGAAATANPVRYLQVTRAIHETEVAAAHNSALAATIGVIHGQSRRFWFAQTEASGTFTEGSAIHAEKLEAIAACDAAVATGAAHRLLDYLERLTRGALDRDTAR